MTDQQPAVDPGGAARAETGGLVAGSGAAPQPAPGAGTLALLALVWLLAMLSSARFTIGDSPTLGPLTLSRAALQLPQVISASLVAGVAVGLAAVNLITRLRPTMLVRRPWRLTVAIGSGLLLGAALGGAIALGYRSVPTIAALGLGVAAAAAIGGLLASVRRRVVVAAGVTGALGVFAVRFVAGIFDVDLQLLFGAGDTAQSVLTASNAVVLTSAMVAGVAAGALAYAYLRRLGPPGVAWPAYLVAGALPGLLALLAEIVTQVGGARLFGLVVASADDQVVQQFLTVTRFNQALVVLFVGALVAILLLGRTLGRGRPADPEEPATQSSS